MSRSRRHLTTLSVFFLAASAGYSSEAHAQANDAAIGAVLTPADQSCGAVGHNVEVLVTNTGTNLQSNIPVQVVVSGDFSATLSGVVAGPLFQNQSSTAILGLINTFAGGNINLNATVMLPGDEVAANNTLTASRYIKPTDITATFEASCPGDSAVISVQPEPLSSFELYDAAVGGTLLDTGNLLTTAPLTTPTTFWVQRINGAIGGGEVDNTFGMGGPYATLTDGLVFNVNTPIVLRAVHVYPVTTGTVQITIRDNFGNPLGASPAYDVQAAEVGMKTAIPVEVNLPIGLNYRLTAEGSDIPLYRNFEGATYPYNISTWVDITGNGTVVPDAYYFFYDWQVAENLPVCGTGRTPVQVGLDLTQCAADMAVDISGPSMADPGSTIEIVTTVSNNGPNTAYSAIVHVPTPAGFKQISNSGDCTNLYPCGLGHLPPNTFATITAVYAVDDDYGGTADFTVLSNSGSIEANPGDETVTLMVTVDNNSGVGGSGGSGGETNSSSSSKSAATGTGSGGGTPVDDGGCNCRTAGSATNGSSSNHALIWLLGGLAVAGARRRKQRAQAQMASLMNRLLLLSLPLALTVVTLFGCKAVETEPPADDTSSTSSSSSSAGGGNVGGAGASGGSDGGQGGEGGSSPCAIDCSTIVTPQCLVSVCNEGQFNGPIGECVVANEQDGASCDDGAFCTISDSCVAGTCTGGPPNDCGIAADACQDVLCNEPTKSCTIQSLADGALCTPSDLCEVNGMCSAGQCHGEAVQCFFAPVPNSCHVAVCNPGTGMCDPIPANDGLSCIDQADLCTVGKSCLGGNCIGGSPLDCTALNIGCNNGVCDTTTGVCISQPVPMGGMCFDGIGSCETGACDANGNCVGTPVMNGTPCDDYSSCTSADACNAGVCTGTLDPMCTTYFEANFEVCPPPGWTLNPEWECGSPSFVGPPAAFEGMNVLGIDLDDYYENNALYDVNFAQTPPIGLGTANNPVMLYQHWVDTEGSVYDGYNLKISTDGGQTFNVLQTVDPPYNLPSVGGEPAYGESIQMWEQVLVDLSAYMGQQVIIRFSFRSDSSGTYPGIYIDDILVVDGDQIPVVITTTNLPSALVGLPYLAQLAHSGGSGMGVWTIQGGTNIAWLGINANTGQLTGTPGAAELGPVTVTVRHEEPTNPTNFDEATYMFNVQSAVFADNIEAACPGAWTLGGNWQCGVPTSGPGAAYSGTQVLGTTLAGDYSDGQIWTTATATTGPISLAGTTAPVLHFWVWQYTEGFGYDGFNVKVSSNGGATFGIVSAVTPPYTQTVGSQNAWGDDTSGLQWTEYTADLSPYAGASIYLQFGFQSDSSVTYPGVYIDDVTIAE